MDFEEASTREKVDCKQPKRDEWEHRKSLAWDTAFFTNPGVLDPGELFGNLNISENEIELDNHSIRKLPCEIAARPSFAWDNAFFTDPGVLDVEELSLVNNGFVINTQLRKSADSTTQGSRFSVASIEFDLFQDLRASLRNSPKAVTRELHPKLPDAKKRTKGYKQKDQLPSLIPQSKVSSSSSSLSSISKLFTSAQAKPQNKCVGRDKGKHKSERCQEQSGSKSIIRSSYSDYSSSSGLRLPLPRMAFFDSDNGEKENREPNAAQATANTRIRHKSKLETSPTLEKPSVLRQRKTRK